MSTSSSPVDRPYPVGTPGVPWGDAERSAWRARQRVQRSFHDTVEQALEDLPEPFERLQYGTLDYGELGSWPLLAAFNRGWHPDRPTVLVTGGVHGYETSGVLGALRFLKEHAAEYLDRVDIMVVPCVSPWGWQTINRWNPDAVDPNRSFFRRPDGTSPSREAGALMDLVARWELHPVLHIDLHETTDTDNSEFRPAKAARDAVQLDWSPIPDGFYTVGHTQRPERAFNAAVIDAVRPVTHIAEPDEHGQIIGVPVESEGVILYDGTRLGLCMGMTDAPYVTTTEVYPDSPRTSPEECIQAQVAAVRGALDYVLARR